MVPGDFGIVFVEGNDATRLTDTFERVGTRDWMPPWAHMGIRIDDVNPSFDVFPLGKVLWSMLSGRRLLPYWFWDDPPNDLVQLFQGVRGMELVNTRILAVTVVDKENKCLPNATELLARVDEVLSDLTVLMRRMLVSACGA